jgi:hypothetical protein
MIVYKIDIRGFAVIEPENNSPIRADGQRQKPFEIAFQRMQTEGRIIEIVDFFGGVEQSQNLFDFTYMLGVHAFGIVVLKKQFQSFMS